MSVGALMIQVHQQFMWQMPSPAVDLVRILDCKSLSVHPADEMRPMGPPELILGMNIGTYTKASFGRQAEYQSTKDLPK